MSDHSAFSVKSPNGAAMALGLVTGKLFDTLIAKGVITNGDVSSIFDLAISSIDVNSTNVADREARTVIKEFAKRFKENQAE